MIVKSPPVENYLAQLKHQYLLLHQAPPCQERVDFFNHNKNETKSTISQYPRLQKDKTKHAPKARNHTIVTYNKPSLSINLDAFFVFCPPAVAVHSLEAFSFTLWDRSFILIKSVYLLEIFYDGRFGRASYYHLGLYFNEYFLQYTFASFADSGVAWITFIYIIINK